MSNKLETTHMSSTLTLSHKTAVLFLNVVSSLCMGYLAFDFIWSEHWHWAKWEEQLYELDVRQNYLWPSLMILIYQGWAVIWKRSSFNKSGSANNITILNRLHEEIIIHISFHLSSFQMLSKNYKTKYFSTYIYQN